MLLPVPLAAICQQLDNGIVIGFSVGFQGALSDICKMQNTRHATLAPCTSCVPSVRKLSKTVPLCILRTHRLAGTLLPLPALSTYWVTGQTGPCFGNSCYILIC